MTDRAEQARAEAECRFAIPADDEHVLVDTNQVEAFVSGVEWADATHPAVEALARVRELHRKSTAVRTLPRQLRKDQADGEPHHYCTYCAEVWPCETYEATEVDA